MLVLTRKMNESLVIDGHIIVTVVDVRAGRVRLAIDAPAEVPVHRSEVQERIRRALPCVPTAQTADELCAAVS